MDKVTRCVEANRMRAGASVRARLDALLDLVRLRDHHIVPFLLEVLRDRHEAEEVRIYVLKHLRNGDGLLTPAVRPLVARAMAEVLADTSCAELRLHAALALGEFAQIENVVASLGAGGRSHPTGRRAGARTHRRYGGRR